MKIFISWSGETSKKVAIELKEWLPFVIQVIEPYVSSEDIYKGERWSLDVSTELENSSFGIICLTPENTRAPWIHFEAGSLSKSIHNSRVSPFLFGVNYSDLSDPFKQFQATAYKKEEIKKLLISINEACTTGKLDSSRLDGIFETMWEKLELKLNVLLEETITLGTEEVKDTTEKSHDSNISEILEEILGLTREQHIMLSSPDKLIDMNYINKNMKLIGSTLIPNTTINLLHSAFDKVAILHNKHNNEKIDIKVPDLTPLLMETQKYVKELSDIVNSSDKKAP